ncbi:hypothetical protein BRC97_10960 [Halobacteriales archaeon QS_6_71_20]|nr:MAG: hypothetical protein BRC97_10960 [Halobacteriales archaeon QS_6_71_20]
MTGLHWLGVALAGVTAVVHLWLAYAFVTGATGLAVGFLVAGVGFLAGAAAVLVDYRRRLFYALGIPFTLGQIGIWVAVTPPGEYLSPVAVTDKLAQVVLVVVLVVLLRRSS